MCHEQDHVGSSRSESAAAGAGATGDGPDTREPIARAERRSTGRCHYLGADVFEAQAAVIDSAVRRYS